MKFYINRDKILRPLQLVSNVVERRQTLPILSNVLLNAEEGRLTIGGTDLEVELNCSAEISRLETPGNMTVSARKLVDICRSLSGSEEILFTQEENRLLVNAGKSRFNLATLPAADFPKIEKGRAQFEFSIPQEILKKSLEATHFAIAEEDVRFYFNGMLFDILPEGLKLIASNGHRMALALLPQTYQGKSCQIILPRKGVIELMRLLEQKEELVNITITENHLIAASTEFNFISKLIDVKYPNYELVIPRKVGRIALLNRETLKQALMRVAILSSDTHRGATFLFSQGQLKIFANNTDQEEAQEELAIHYEGADLELGLNLDYFLDVCSAIKSEEIKVTFSSASGSIILQAPETNYPFYVIMPMKM